MREPIFPPFFSFPRIARRFVVVLEGERIVASFADGYLSRISKRSIIGGREVDLRRVTKFVQRSSPINHSTAETPTAGIYR